MKKIKPSFKPLKVIDGFAKPRRIPSSINGLIASFCGQPALAESLIIGRITTFRIDHERLKFGTQLEIMYDPLRPKMMNVPTRVLADQENSDRSDGIVGMASCCICLTVVVFLIIAGFTVNIVAAIFFIGALAVGSCIIADLCLWCLSLINYAMDQNKDFKSRKLRKTYELFDEMAKGSLRV